MRVHFCSEPLAPLRHADMKKLHQLQVTLLLGIPPLGAIVSLTLLGLMAVDGWPGAFAETGAEYCEAFRDSVIKQPSNTWSNLGFVVAGLWITWGLRRDLLTGTQRPNPVCSRPTLSTLYATLVVLLGPGSMAMHGSGTEWGETTDVLSMLLYIAFPAAYSIIRISNSKASMFTPVYVGLIALPGVPLLTGVMNFSGSTLYLLLVPGVAISELWRCLRNPGTRLARKWLLLATGLFVTGFVIWLLSHTGAPLCDPASLIQGHAVWHLLSAAATVALFRYYQSETP